MTVHLPGNQTIDWVKVDLLLMERCTALRPWEIDDYTLAEIFFCLQDPREHRPHAGRGQYQSDQERQAEIDRWRRMTPKQRLLTRLEE